VSCCCWSAACRSRRGGRGSAPAWSTAWDGGRDELCGLRIDDDVPSEQNAADHLPGVPGRVVLAVFDEFEADLLKMRTREGMAIARSRGRLKGKKPKLTARQQAELVRMHATGGYTIADLMKVFSVGHATVYRVLDRAGAEPGTGTGLPPRPTG
jgi:hypothetical protein